MKESTVETSVTDNEVNEIISSKPARLFCEKDKVILGSLIDTVVLMFEATNQDDTVNPFELERKLLLCLKEHPGHGTLHLISLLHALVREKNEAVMKRNKTQKNEVESCDEHDEGDDAWKGSYGE